MSATRAVLAFAFIASLAASSAAASQTATTATAPAPRQSAATPPKKQGFDPNAVICKSEVPTGTMFAQKVCLTSAQWDQSRQEDVDAIQRRSAVPQPPSGVMGH
jgi:ABC-type transport system substrate-binding protein